MTLTLHETEDKTYLKVSLFQISVISVLFALHF